MTGRAVVGLLVLVAAVAPAARAGTRDPDRAHLAAAQLEQAFDARDGLYRSRVPGGSVAEAWGFSQAVAAVVAVAALPDATPADRALAARRVAQLERYRGRLGYRSTIAGGDTYVDDNEWIALDLLDWYGLSHDPDSLRRALRAFGLAVTGWDGRAGDPCSGGVYWVRAAPNRDRNTVTTAVGAVLGLRLYGILHRPELLWWSTRMLDWLDRCMRAPSGLYWDHIDSSGSVDTTLWSYNQGSVIAADVLLAQATGDRSALTRAEALADASVGYFAPGSRQPPIFLALLARDLLLLDSALGVPRYRPVVEAYADADPEPGSLAPRADLLSEAARLQLYTALASPG